MNQKDNIIIRDAILELEIEKAGFEGTSITRLEDFVIFVEGSVPGDRVRAQIMKKKKNYAEAKVLEIIKPSEYRVKPACNHFGVCGGCKWQHLDYTQQLYWKCEHVRDAFEKIGGFKNVVVHDVIPAENIFFYRNKMEFTFGEKRWRLQDELHQIDESENKFTLGMHVAARYDKILHIEECWLQSELSNKILAFTRKYFLEKNIPAYTTRTHTGDLRHLVIREAKITQETMVYLITTNTSDEVIYEYGALLQQNIPEVDTLIHGSTNRKAMVAQSDFDRILFGSGIIKERLGNCVFEISPSSFFQSNTLQAEKLYTAAKQYSDFIPTDVVWDLYCGIGTISLFIAPFVSSIIGVELNNNAVNDAIKNAKLNGMTNCTFVCDDIVRFVEHQIHDNSSSPDVIILDPPRAGLHPDVVKAIGQSPVKRVVYVSCNPTTSARDAKALAVFGFQILEIQPVDMFPHTYHIESVIKFGR